MNCYQLLEHTADMGIEAQGETPDALFRQMALGLREIMTGCVDIGQQSEIIVKVEGKCWEDLLVNWLGELVFLLEARHFLPGEFSIEQLDENRLVARVLGEIFDPARHYVDREIKAVTYHQVRVEQNEDGWVAQVFVDL